MSRYTTISVPVPVKRELEKLKKKREWGEFLLDLANEARVLRGRKAFDELPAMLSEDKLDCIEKESLNFREGFKLR